MAWGLVQLLLWASSSGRAIAAIRRRVRELGTDRIEVMLPDFGYSTADPQGARRERACPVYRAAIVDPAILRPTPMRSWTITG
jgi:hypothetical protein